MAPTVYLVLGFLLLAVAFVVFRILVRRDYRKKGRLTPLSVSLEYGVFFLWGTFTYLTWSSAASSRAGIEQCGHG